MSDRKPTPRPHRFSSSMKVATISFTIPGDGRCIVQENPGVVSAKLRRAIKAAYKTFWSAYEKRRAI